jgi:hypothetical protein
MARIMRQVTVVRDGHHNGFTDLCCWQGAYWVSYRKGAGHVSADACAALSVSADRARFREVAQLKVPGDNRDPKLFVISDTRLAMFFPTWVEAFRKPGVFERRGLQQYVAFSSDGFNWAPPVPILRPNRWLWRVSRWNGRFYGASYGLPEGGSWDRREIVKEFLVSDDFVRWDVVSRIGTPDLALGESDQHIHADGEVWMVSRSPKGAGHSWFASARPPYTQWELTDLGTLIHAPAIVEHEGALYVAGRRSAKLEGDTTFPYGEYSLGVWRLDRGRVTPVMRVPASGDCSYPGLIRDPDGRICMSYYSQHAYMTGVLPGASADDPTAPGGFRPLSRADVYFAELDLA